MENENTSQIKSVTEERIFEMDSDCKIKVLDERVNIFSNNECDEEEREAEKNSDFKNSSPGCFERESESFSGEPDEDTQEAIFIDSKEKIDMFKCIKEDTDSISIIDIKAYKDAAFTPNVDVKDDQFESFNKKPNSSSFNESGKTDFFEHLESSSKSTETESKIDLMRALKLTVSNNDTNFQPDVLGQSKEEIQDQPSQAKMECNQPSSIIFEDRQLPLEDMFVCQSCGRVFSNQYKLDSHQFRNHISSDNDKQSRYQSENNDSWPPNVQKLARRVNGVKVFFCNLCSYSVNRCDSMSKHMLRVHSEGRVVPQYMCEVCGKVFIDKAYLRNHSVSHVTNRQHSCEFCGQMFHRQASLKRHRQSHSADKQFACTLCDYKTNRKHLMYKHVDHHKTGRSYTCKICDSKFYTQISFRSHMYTHHISPNSCSFCKVYFSSKERMMCHLKRVHFAYEIKELNKLKELKEEHESVHEYKVFEV